MGKRAHPRFTTAQKIAIWIVVLMCAWQFLPLYSVVEAALLFLFGGEVPGTNIVLAPNTVMMSMGGIFLCGTLFFLIKGLVHLFRDPANHIASANNNAVTANRQAVAVAAAGATARQAVHQEEYAIPQFALQAIVANLPEAIAKASTEPLPNISDSSKIRDIWNALSPKLATGLAKSKNHSQNLWQKGQLLAQRAAHLAWVGAVIAWIVGRRATRIASKWIARQAAAFWRWVVPYLWQFDSWLGKQYLIYRKKFLKLYREVKRAIKNR